MLRVIKQAEMTGNGQIPVQAKAFSVCFVTELQRASDLSGAS